MSPPDATQPSLDKSPGDRVSTVKNQIKCLFNLSLDADLKVSPTLSHVVVQLDKGMCTCEKYKSRLFCPRTSICNDS